MAKKKQVAGKKDTKKEADTKNKGEWGERYCFPKIIHTKEIRLGDKDLNIPDNNKRITISKLTTADLQQSFSVKQHDRVTVTNGAGVPKEIDVTNTINENTLNRVMSKIKEEKKGSTFELPELKSIEKALGVDNMKGGTSSQKADIYLDIKHDGKTNEQVGFSIKAGFGTDPSLLNASGQTNFVYEIEGFPKESMSEVNKITTGNYRINRIKKINELRGKFKYAHMTSESFSENLSKIDKNLPELISMMLLQFYVDKGKTKKTSQWLSCNLCKLSYSGELNSINSNWKKNLQSPEAIIKKLLITILFGMVPSKEWDDKQNAEGLIVVKENGDLVCFYKKNFTAGMDYLFEYAYFETPKSGATKTTKEEGDRVMTELYEKDEKVYINLNLQIRLKVG